MTTSRFWFYSSRESDLSWETNVAGGVERKVRIPEPAQGLLCFLPSCAMYKDNAVRNVVAEIGRDLVFMITARLSDLSMPLKGEVRRLTCTVCTAADSEERQICTTCLFAESVGLWKRRRSYLYVCVCFLMYAFSHRDRGAHFCLRGLGEEGRIDVAPRSQTPKTSCQNHKQQLLRPRSGPSKVARVK